MSAFGLIDGNTCRANHCPADLLLIGGRHARSVASRGPRLGSAAAQLTNGAIDGLMKVSSAARDGYPVWQHAAMGCQSGLSRCTFCLDRNTRNSSVADDSTEPEDRIETGCRPGEALSLVAQLSMIAPVH